MTNSVLSAWRKLSIGAPSNHPCEGLNVAVYVEGKNVAVEFRWMEGQLDRLPAPAADLVTRPVAILVATGGSGSELPSKA